QRTARMSGLLSHVLLTQRAQFLHKVGTLQELVEDIGKDLRKAAEELSSGADSESDLHWDAIDHDHYDLNTCLREAIILFKSFLLALPDDQVSNFQTAVSGHMLASSKASDRQLVIRHRRIPQIAGQ